MVLVNPRMGGPLHHNHKKTTPRGSSQQRWPSNRRQRREYFLKSQGLVHQTNFLYSNGIQRSLAQKPDDSMPHRSVPSPSTHAPPSRVREPMRPASKLNESRSATPSQQDRDGLRPSAGTPVNATTSVPPRPEGRHTPQPNPVGRPAHVLPSRPDAHSSRSRQPERPGVERPLEHGPHSRYENRAPPSDYGRLDRTGEAPRQREPSPGRRGRPGSSGRTPERMPPVVDQREWSARDGREYEDRAMRAPLRDARAPPVRPPVWDPRDQRDQRDQRDRPDSRGHPVPVTMEPRRVASNSSLSHEHNSHRRDLPPQHVRQGPERNEHGPLPHTSTVPSSTAEGPTVNPARAALINEAEIVRAEPPRPDRDGRGDRGPRVQSPRGGQGRRGEDRRPDERYVDEHPSSAYQGRNELPREHREDRGPPLAHLNNRERRDEPTASTPTGPRGGRNEPLLPVGTAREMFQPRSSRAPAQDPNYGRLNQPAEPTPPAGPRSTYNAPNTDLQAQNTPGSRPHPMSLPPTPTPPSGPAASMSVGIHPSRLENIQRPPLGPALQTNMSSLPSGPRGNGRAPPGGVTSPVSRGPPTGPSTAERGPRVGDRRNPLGAINSVLKENAPAVESRSNDRSDTTQYPPVRGRGATRAHGPPEPTAGMSSPMPPPSQVSTPNARGEGHHARSSRADNATPRMEGTPQDDGRTESRGHRDSRRGERSGRDRSRSPDRSERRPDERSTRETQPRIEGEERGPERERVGREKRGSERESSSRREREGERSAREPGREAREPREAGRRERGSRDDGRTSGREERRSRGGGSGDDGRKRTRDPLDQGQGHGDPKRRR
jgi:THO complex subunit 2